MKIASQTEYVSARLNDYEAVRMVCEAGFDAIDFSMFHMKHDDCPLNSDSYKEIVKKLKAIADSYGKSFCQAHAPFPTMRDGDEEYNKNMLPKVKRSIEIAGMLGVENIVVHPVFFAENKFEKNMAMYNELLPVAKKAGVKIALENMFGKKDPVTRKQTPNVCSLPEEFAEFYDALPREYFTCCVDIGHCALVGSTPEEMLRGLGDRVGCLHVHDNDTFDDWHFPPFTLDLNWTEIAKALADIDYKGEFTLEADSFLRKYDVEFQPTASRFMADVCKHLTDKIEAYKAIERKIIITGSVV
jgi:sugar phosphate isomerase/epimerase